MADVDVKTNQVRGLYSHCFPILELLISSSMPLLLKARYLCGKNILLEGFASACVQLNFF